MNKIYIEPISNSLKHLSQLLALIVLFSLPSITHNGYLNARLMVSVENQYQNVSLVSNETNLSSFIQFDDSNKNRINSDLPPLYVPVLMLYSYPNEVLPISGPKRMLVQLL